MYAGESGLVYKASLETIEGRELVAVKTVKGILLWRNHFSTYSVVMCVCLLSG